MFDGLIEILMEWLEQAWCWLLDRIVQLAVAVMQLISSLLPSVSVPGWLSGSPMTQDMISFAVWIVPTGPIIWTFSVYLAYELVTAVLVPLYRAFMDLL